MNGLNGQKPNPWGGDVDRALKNLIDAAEGVYHSCTALEEGVPKNVDVAHLCNAANDLIIETHESKKKMERALKDYRLSQIPGRKK